MTSSRDAEFADFVATREASLRRLAIVLCQDWHRADDLVQAAITKLYVHWPKAKAAGNLDAYVRAIVVREFLDERRSSWIRRVTLTSQLPDRPAAGEYCDIPRSWPKKHLVIHGYRFTLAIIPGGPKNPVRRQPARLLCGRNEDGLFVNIYEVGAHQPLTPTGIMYRLELLGARHSGWVTNPLA